MLAQLYRNNELRRERLLQLYWNRAGVKRELKSLQAERFALLDKLKDQENAINRAREELDGLERLLVNPLAAANAMVYFQLRNIWRVSSQRIEQLGSELETQRETRERKQLHDAALAKRGRRLAGVKDNAETLADQRRTLRAEATELKNRIGSLNILTRLIQGKAMIAALASLDHECEAITARLVELDDLAEKIQGEPLPEIEGLSVESRRTINAALIALAQHLVLHFSPNKLALLSREAMTKSVSDMRFGDRRECDRMVESIRGRTADLTQEDRLADLVRQRASMLSKEFEYSNETDAVPNASATSTITPLIDDKHIGRRATDTHVHVNVLSDDYWDLGRFLR